MLDPVFGFQFIQTTTGFPERCPRTEMRRKSRTLPGTAAPGGRWALGTGAAKEELHPGVKSTALRVSSGRGQRWKIRLGRSGVFHGRQAAPTSAWEHTQLLCSSAAAPPRLLLQSQNPPAAPHIGNSALTNGTNLIPTAPQSRSTATKPGKLGCMDLQTATDEASIPSRC